MRSRALLAFALLVTSPFVVAATPDPSCPAVKPADLPGPARWLGPCPSGRAEGMGVLRIGAAAPFAFFAGRMAAGRLGEGVVVRPDGLFEVAVGFDARGRSLPTDSLHPEQQDEVFAVAVQAAQATANRFTQLKNRGSADFYRRLALRIRNGLPE